jgi:hypothetical protein
LSINTEPTNLSPPIAIPSALITERKEDIILSKNNGVHKCHSYM